MKTPVRWAALLLWAIVITAAITSYILNRDQSDRNAVFTEMVVALKNSTAGKEGYWVGDVTNLFRLGRISRAVAEADTAPLQPLVPKPVPFHGYYVQAMDWGPDGIPAKGRIRSWSPGMFAYCIYPAQESTQQQTWVVCPYGMFRKDERITKPLLDWPDVKGSGQGWWTVD